MKGREEQGNVCIDSGGTWRAGPQCLPTFLDHRRRQQAGEAQRRKHVQPAATQAREKR